MQTTDQLVIILRDEVLLPCHDGWVRLKQLDQMIDCDLDRETLSGFLGVKTNWTDWFFCRVGKEYLDDDLKLSPPGFVDFIWRSHDH